MTDTTQEAPERVWADMDGCWWDKPYGESPEYVRADLVQAAVAAKLREAADTVEDWGRLLSGTEDVSEEVIGDILALITPDAQAALDRVVAAERERCAKVAESVALPMDGKIAKAQAGYMRGIIAHHIREGGE